MRVLFSNPPWWGTQRGPYWCAGVRAGSRWPFTLLIRSQPDAFRFGDYLPYPFFMGYAATYAQRALGAQVAFRDSIALRESYRNYFRYLEEGHFDYLFMEIATPSWQHDQHLILAIHKYFPAVKIVVTGPIASTKSEEILEHFPVHACIRGEYEKGSVQVLQGRSGVIDFDLLTKEDMNQAPFPYNDLLHAPRYWDGNPRGQLVPQAQVWSSRGCPFKCIFCVWPATMTGKDPDGTGQRTVRHYTAEYMEAFLTDWISRYNYRCIYFDDDTFNLGNSHVLKMCEVMQRLKLPWSAMCRADTIKLETWQIMKESGCFGVKIGFESGNQFVVDKIVNKHLDLEFAASVVRHLKTLGMTVHGTFTYGLPGETAEQMQDTRRFIAALQLDTYQESGTAEIEGTPLHTLGQRGILESYEGAKMDANYTREADGAKKWQMLVEEFRQAK
jgi:radical SAM superfamily enzyme YgiQ (UPF0313 family)